MHAGELSLNFQIIKNSDENYNVTNEEKGCKASSISRSYIFLTEIAAHTL